MNCGICDALGGCNCQSKEDGSGFDDFVELGETIYGYSPEYYESYCKSPLIMMRQRGTTTITRVIS